MIIWKRIIGRVIASPCCVVFLKAQLSHQISQINGSAMQSILKEKLADRHAAI